MNSFEKRHATLELQQAAHFRHVVSTKTNATCVDWHGLAVVVEMTHLPFQLNHCDSLFVCLKQPTERWRVVSTYLHLRFAFSIGWSWIFVVTLSCCIWDTNCIKLHTLRFFGHSWGHKSQIQASIGPLASTRRYAFRHAELYSKLTQHSQASKGQKTPVGFV